MKAWQVTEWCEPEGMHWNEIEVPKPKPGQVLIRVRASALNFFDILQVQGKYQVKPPFPFTPGAEVSGEVEAVGEGVTHLKVGDRAAYASNPPGSYSEARVMPAKTVCKLPDGISFETGAAMMLKGMTAGYLLKRTLPVEGLQKGDRLEKIGLVAIEWEEDPRGSGRKLAT